MATVKRSETDAEWEIDRANSTWAHGYGMKRAARCFDMLIFKYELKEGWKRSALGCYRKYPALIQATRMAEIRRFDEDYRAVDEMVSEALNDWNETTNQLTIAGE